MVLSGPPWLSSGRLREHFRKHHRELSVATVQDYDSSARKTIQNGKRFTYIDRRSGLRRVGYFEAATGRFTALTDGETAIITHFVADDHYVRNVLPSSTYT